MKFLIFSVTATTLLLFRSASVIIAQENQPSKNQSTVIVSEDEIINRTYLASGDTIRIQGTINGDTYLLGGDISVEGTINGDLLAVGGVVNITGNISQDARIAGGRVNVDGVIGQNLTVGGGDVEIGQGATLGGGIVGAAGNIVLAAPIAGSVQIAAGDLTVSDEVRGDLETAAGTVRLTQNAVVDGDFVYASETNLSVDENAQIHGNRVERDLPGFLGLTPEEAFQFFVGVNLFLKFISFLAALVVGLLLIRLFPKLSQSFIAKLSQEPLKSLGVGLLILILTPILAVALIITIVGIPLALILLAIYFILLYLAKIFVALWLGSVIFRRFGKEGLGFYPLLVGLLIYYLLSLIPFLGVIVNFFVLLFGLGVFYLVLSNLYFELRNKENV